MVDLSFLNLGIFRLYKVNDRYGESNRINFQINM